MIHRWLQIGRPERDAKDPGPDLSPLANLSVASWGMEVSRSAGGRVAFRVLAPDSDSMSRVARVLGLSFPHVSVLEEAPCAAPQVQEHQGWRFARARPSSPHHYWPLNISQENDRWATDYQETLVSVLGSPSLGPAEVVVQVLARKVGAWESGLFSSRYDKLVLGLQGKHETLFNGSWTTVPTQFDQEKLKRIERRRATSPSHVELRAMWRAPPTTGVIAALRPWLAQWTTMPNSGTWRWFEEINSWPLVAPHRAERFARAVVDHDLSCFALRKEVRDGSADEVATLLAPPWRRWHASLSSPRTPSLLGLPTRSEGLTSPGSPSPRPSVRNTGLTPSDPESIIAALREKVGASAPLPPATSSTRRAAPFDRTILPPTPTAADGWALGSLAGITLRLPPDWRHMGVIGGTGTGKSTLLLNVILQAILDPHGGTIVVLDPTGALIEDVKARLPLSIVKETVEFDPSHLHFQRKSEEWVSPGFNLLDLPTGVRDDHGAFDRGTSLVVSDLIRSFHDSWGTESVGARAGYFLNSLLKGLMARPGTNILDVRDVIVDKPARERYVRWLPSEADFEGSFAKDELGKYRIEDFISTLDKTGWFGGSHTLRGALCQREAPTPFARFLGHRLVLLNVSRGLVGKEICKILGSAFLSMLWSERLAHGRRAPPITLVIDEAQTFPLPSLSQMLSEGRKYGVRVVLANQYFQQLPEDLRAAMGGNGIVWCCFRTGPDDAKAAHKLTQAGQWDYAESRFVSLPDHQFVCNVLTHSDQGWWQTSPPPQLSPDAPTVIESLRERMRRDFSTRETSTESPFRVEQETLGPVCFAVSEGIGLIDDIVEELGIPKRDVFAALRRAEDLGYVTWDPKTKENRITPLGQDFVDAWRARRVTETEGELHIESLAKLSHQIHVMFGVSVRITPQGSSSKPLPDATFEKGPFRVHVEFECTTLTTKGPQVVKNLRKAREVGAVCLFGVPSRERADRLLQVVGELAPDAKLGIDFAVASWDGSKYSFLPSGVSADGFPFLAPLPTAGGCPSASPAEGAPENLSSAEAAGSTASSASDRDIIRSTFQDLRARGVLRPTGPQVLDAVPLSEKHRFPLPKSGRFTTRIGTLAAELRVPTDFDWDPEKKNNVRVYVLSEWLDGAITSASPPEIVQEAET